MRTTNVLTTLRVSRQLLAANAEPKSRKLVRVDDVPSVRIHADRPIALQMDGDYIGRRESVEFSCIPQALEVVAPAVR